MLALGVTGGTSAVAVDGGRRTPCALQAVPVEVPRTRGRRKREGGVQARGRGTERVVARSLGAVRQRGAPALGAALGSGPDVR